MTVKWLITEGLDVLGAASAVSTPASTFNPAFSDMVLEAFSRIQVRPTSLTADHMRNALISGQLILSEWSNRQVNLWKVQLLSTTLVQGQATYAVPSNVVTILDAYIRQFDLNTAVNYTPQFTTVVTSTTVRVTQPNHGLLPGQFMNLVIPVSVGGLVLGGFYTVDTVLGVNDYTILADGPATASVSHGGAVPVFTTTAGSTSVQVTLAANGIFAGQDFTVDVAVSVGGLQLSGPYTVATVIDLNNFTITAPSAAGTSAVQSENGGLTQIQTQSSNPPDDRVVTPISRTDYSNQPNKEDQAFPTTFWLNRQISPQFVLWPTPDNGGPYSFQYYAVVQVSDVSLPAGATLDLPYRWFDAYASALAARLARKYAPTMAAELKLEAETAWQFAAVQDQENAPLYIQPGLGGYYR